MSMAELLLWRDNNMDMLQKLFDAYGKIDYRDLGSRQLEMLRDDLKKVSTKEIQSVDDGKEFIDLLRKFREAVAENDKFHGENYPQLLNSILSVGEDGLYSNSLRFIFELIQNVDDCEFADTNDCKLDMYFDFNKDEIVLTYNEVGFTPFNVFAITGIAEAAKNVSASKNEIGEKGIGFKSVFGVAKHVLIRSGWFSFELYKDNFTIPISAYEDDEYCSGTQMTLYVPGKTRNIYRQIRDQYCRKEALFGKNPLLFLNKLTSLKLYYDGWRSMEFKVSRADIPRNGAIHREDKVKISVNLRDYENGTDKETIEEITCTRYSYPVVYNHKSCQSRYGEKTLVGSQGGKLMYIQAVIPYPEDIDKVGNGGLYSFLPTQLAFTVPVVCHAPFKLDASREFVDPQDKDDSGGNLWFKETTRFLAELMDYVFDDWARTIRQNIIRYLPYRNASLFAINNGKEKCLRDLELFRGKHYLTLSLFETANGEYRKADDIFCFKSSDIREPIKVAKMLNASKALFIAPDGVDVGKYGILLEQDVCDQLFRKALCVSGLTETILEYLNAVGYEYSEKLLPQNKLLELKAEQIECIMRTSKLADIMIRIASKAINSDKRPRFAVIDAAITPVSDVILNQFELNETPKSVEKYMQFCKESCICLDIKEGGFLPCYNGIVLSVKNPLSSFAAFCYKMDPSDTFAIRVKLREASTKLNRCVESNSGTATEYLRDLRNVRLTIKDSIGKKGYQNYLRLILKSGSDRSRFIQELIQNADDCDYPDGQIPTFTLTQHGEKIRTEYNEIGFTRANIRAITAIGESTKNSLLEGDLSKIGEKGVGFKTVFAIASEVKIFSGEYNFLLKAEEPTVPKIVSRPETIFDGTRMEIELKNSHQTYSLKATDILELCLCLRKLKNLNINGHKVSIKDADNQRTISIDNRTYSFSTYIHEFIISDEKALEERKNGTREIISKQQIVCYVPEKFALTDYPLYNGLPTKHRIRIPMAIDAPFELTTSREEIEVGCNAWNDIIREEMYNAIVKVIHRRKWDERASVLRFARVKFKISGKVRQYVNDLSDLQYINSYNYLSILRLEEIIPTFNSNTFVSIVENRASKYPTAVTQLLNEFPNANYGALKLDTVIDSHIVNVSKEQRDRIETVFNALDCEIAPFAKVFPVLRMNAELFIRHEAFRNNLYDYLQNVEDSYKDELKELKIIPVYGKNDGTEYISWEENSIFVKNSTRVSTESYWILNEKLLSKSMCEKMLGVNINEMNSEWEKTCYKRSLQEIIKGSNPYNVYRYLISEFMIGNLQKNECLGILLELKDDIPLKNEIGELTKNELFLCNQPSGYFAVEMLERITVHKECEGFAEFIKCCNLSDIHYNQIGYSKNLNEDDVEVLQDDYFYNSEEILRGFYRDNYLSDELLKEYNLEYLDMGKLSVSDYGEFPEERVVNRDQLKLHIGKLLKNPIKIVAVKVERSVQKGQDANGETFELGRNDARNGALITYAPDGKNKVCFCQMCHKVKQNRLIEVNNIEIKPQYYFPQLRIALCLECSKIFELLRQNVSIRNDFIESIKNSDTLNCGQVDVPIGSEETITFTAKHLAEIQEIMMKLSNI